MMKPLMKDTPHGKRVFPTDDKVLKKMLKQGTVTRDKSGVYYEVKVQPADEQKEEAAPAEETLAGPLEYDGEYQTRDLRAAEEPLRRSGRASRRAKKADD